MGGNVSRPDWGVTIYYTQCSYINTHTVQMILCIKEWYCTFQPLFQYADSLYWSGNLLISCPFLRFILSRAQRGLNLTATSAASAPYILNPYIHLQEPPDPLPPGVYPRGIHRVYQGFVFAVIIIIQHMRNHPTRINFFWVPYWYSFDSSTHKCRNVHSMWNLRPLWP